MGFWRELKGRVADPDPQARAPITGEVADLRRPHRRLPVPAAAGRRDPDRLHRRHRRPQAGEARWPTAEPALAEAERLKRDFVGNVSYELRTPLTTIIGYSELLERSGEAPVRARRAATPRRCKSAATQLARSIDDVLDMAQIDADEMALDLEDVRVADLLDAAGRALGARGRGRPASRIVVELPRRRRPDPRRRAAAGPDRSTT